MRASVLLEKEKEDEDDDDAAAEEEEAERLPTVSSLAVAVRLKVFSSLDFSRTDRARRWQSLRPRIDRTTCITKRDHRTRATWHGSQTDR